MWYQLMSALPRQAVFLAEGERLRCRRSQRDEFRKVVIDLIRELCYGSLNEIAEVFCLGKYASVGVAYVLIQRDMNSDQRLRSRIQQIRETCVERYAQERLDPFTTFTSV